MMIRENDIAVTRDMTIKSLNQLLSEKRKEVIGLHEQLSSKSALLMKVEAEIARLKALLKPFRWTSEKPTEPGLYSVRVKGKYKRTVVEVFEDEYGALVVYILGVDEAIPMADMDCQWSDRPIQMPEEE